MTITSQDESVEHIQNKIEDMLFPNGFEVHPFLVGWYNELVGSKFHLDHPDNTVAFIIISQPSMFVKAFLPFLESQYKTV